LHDAPRGVLTVSMATTHIGYAEVPRKLSVERVLDVIELTAKRCRGCGAGRHGWGCAD